MNYEVDISIDDSALDVEWLEQPTLMLRYTQHEANALDAFDRAKNELDLVTSELDKEMRLNPTKFDIDKITDKAIESRILTMLKYKSAVEKMLNCKHEYNSARAAVKAFEQRKDALENLVKLHGQQYFAGPKVPRDLSNEYQIKKAERDKLNARIAEKIARTK